MPEIDPQLMKERKRIMRRRHQLRIYLVYALAVFVLAIILIGLSNNSLIQKNSIIHDIIELPTFISLFGWLYLMFQTTKFQLSYEDTMFLSVYNAIENLEAYFEDENEGYRKKSLRKANLIMLDISSWKGGRLKVYQNEMGSHVNSFKEAFYRKVLGALKQTGKNDLKEAFLILTQFALYLANPNSKIADLDSITANINKQISVSLPPKSESKLTLNYLKTHHYFNDTLACIVSVVLGFAVGVIGYYGLGVPNEYNYPISVTVVLGLVAVYFGYLRKGQR